MMLRLILGGIAVNSHPTMQVALLEAHAAPSVLPPLPAPLRAGARCWFESPRAA